MLGPHIPVGSYCFLCGEGLMSWSLCEAHPGGNWYENLVVIPFPPPRRCTVKATLRLDGFQIGRNLFLSSGMVTLCSDPSCEECFNTSPVPVGHQDCWAVATAAGKTVCDLYKYAARHRKTALPRYSAPPYVTPTFYADVRTTTSLGRLVRNIADRLPVELQYEIGQHLGGHFVGSLLHTSFAVGSVRQIRPYHGPKRRAVVCKGPVRSLYVDTRSLFGLHYISEVGLNKHRGDFIETNNVGVRGLRFAFGSHGLRALRLLFNDGSMSRWLGDPRYCWYGEFYGGDLKTLSVTRDTYLVFRVDFGYFSEGWFHPNVPWMMWNSEEPLRPDLRLSSAVTATCTAFPPAYPRWGFQSYLSFGIGTSYTKGILAHYYRSRVLGLTTITTPRQRIGFALGHPDVLLLARGERVVSVWVCAAGPGAGFVFAGPCLLMGTSYGRFKLFGDCRVAHWPGSNWTCIVDDCVVTGLYLDNFDLGAYRDNFALGTTSLPRPSNAYWPRFVPIIPGGDMPGVIHRVAWDTPVFLTTASLRGVVFLAACGGAGRCSGLVLRYWSGRTEVLGAANARGQDTASVIYNAMRDGPLRCLLFTHDEQDSVRRIRAVKVVKDDDDEVDPGESEVVCRENVAWWVAGLSDAVEEWNGLWHPVLERMPLGVVDGRTGATLS